VNANGTSDHVDAPSAKETEKSTSSNLISATGFGTFMELEGLLDPREDLCAIAA